MVVLPEPLGPRITQRSPGRTCQSIPSRTRRPARSRRTERNSRGVMGARHLMHWQSRRSTGDDRSMAGIVDALTGALREAFDRLEPGADRVVRPSNRPGVDFQVNGAVAVARRL